MLGEKIATYRKRMSITQEALAQKLGVTNQAVSKWESDGSCPDIQLLPALADIFGITIDELFGRERRETAVRRELPWEEDDTLRIVVYQGHRLLKHAPAGEKLLFVYEGPALNICSAVSVACGDVSGSVDAGVEICCGNVGGNADAGKGIHCGNIGGNADAGAEICCGNIGGNVDAGGNVTCGAVKGSVDAGGSIMIQN